MATSGQSGMTSEHRNKLKVRRVFLMCNTDPNEEFFSLLIQKDVVTADMVQRIKVGNSLYDIWEKLLNNIHGIQLYFVP